MGKSARRKREREKTLLEQGSFSNSNVDSDGDALMDRDNTVGHTDSAESESQQNRFYRLDQRQQTTRIQQCHDKDYYGILGLEENCTREEIRSTYLKLGLLTHPDQNRYNDAPIAFQKLSAAYDVLHNPKSRAEYDLIGDQYKRDRTRNAEKVFGEAFADNAAGDESEAASEDEHTLPKPDVEVVRVYSEATELVNRYLEAHEDIARESGKKGIGKLNKKIRKINQQSGRPEDEGLIKINLLYGFANNYQTAAQRGGNNVENLTKIQKQFDHMKNTHYYPELWRLPDIPGMAVNSEEAQTQNQRDHEAAEQIIGYIPSSGFCGPSFVVKSPRYATGILIKKDGDVNGDMARAYLALPDEEKNDVRRSQERYSKADRTAYDRILGWDNVLSAKWNPETRGSLPRAFGLIQFKNGSTNILSRTTLRKVLGARTADAEINRFYQELDITPPWATMPRFKAILGPERAPVESAHKNAAVLGSVGTSSSDDSWAVRRKYAVRSQYPDKEKRSVNTQQDRRSEDAIRTMIEQHQQQMKAMTDTITELLKRVNM